MKFHTMSLVAGNGACNADCVYCIGKKTVDMGGAVQGGINKHRLKTACLLAERCGVTTVLITGKGEPTLYKHQIISYLEELNYRFPLVELQTNGYIDDLTSTIPFIQETVRLGLTTVCISRASLDDDINKRFMNLDFPMKRLQVTIGICQAWGLSVRMNFVGCSGGIDTFDKLKECARWAKDIGVAQVTWRPVHIPKGNPHLDYLKLTASQEIDIYSNMICNAVTLLRLPHNGIVFDLEGQNVCLTNCLTRNSDPEQIRQLIFYPNGELYYDWQYPGARIL